MSEIDNDAVAPATVPMFLFDDVNGVYLGAFSKPFPEGFPPPGAVEISEPHDVLPSSEQSAAIAIDKKDSLLRDAAMRIAPLQYAADIDDATDAELAVLKSWKQYSVAVNRVAEQPGFPETIDWPVAPGQEGAK